MSDAKKIGEYVYPHAPAAVTEDDKMRELAREAHKVLLAMCVRTMEVNPPRPQPEGSSTYTVTVEDMGLFDALRALEPWMTLAEQRAAALTTSATGGAS